MNDKEITSTLSASCIKALNDKLYDKRKTGALEVEKTVREYNQQNNTAQIKKTLKILGSDFTLSHNPHSKKGGLIGLAASAIALGQDASNYIEDLVKPILECFADSDSRIRYYACEAMYNVCKVARSATLTYFNEIFDGLSLLAADPDQNVKHGSELLDRLVKDIVTESKMFDVVQFIPLLRDRINTKNPFARQFLVSWVTALESDPNIDLLPYLPEFLDGLFNILGDSNVEIRRNCSYCISEFLNNIIKADPNDTNISDKLPDMLGILILQCQSTDEQIQSTSIIWIKHFLSLAGRDLMPYTQGLLKAVLPCLSYADITTLGSGATQGTVTQDTINENIRRGILEEAKQVNNELMKLVGEEKDGDGAEGETQGDMGSGPAEILDSVSGVQETSIGDTAPASVDLKSVIHVLGEQLVHSVSIRTRIAVLRWIHHLLVKLPHRTFAHVDELFPILLKTLSDPSDEVVLLDLEVLSEISSSPAGSVKAIDAASASASGDHDDDDGTLIRTIMSSILPPPATSDTQQSSSQRHVEMNEYFARFIIALLRLFSTDGALLDDRGAFIIRQLCILVHAEDLYRALSVVLCRRDGDHKFTYHMVQTLNTILLTSTELFHLRTQLKDFDTPGSRSLFLCLYKCWCHNPVATISLCLLTQNYRHSCKLLHMFGNLEITVEFLTEIDKLIQLIESPVFTFLRLQLLNIEDNHYLLRSLYGLLMLLPQSDAFRVLHSRLQCVPLQNMALTDKRASSPSAAVDVKSENTSHHTGDTIDYSYLLEYFTEVQHKRAASSRQTRAQMTRPTTWAL